MKRVAFLCKANHTTRAKARELAELLLAAGVEPVFLAESGVECPGAHFASEAEWLDEAALLVVLGGDGTLLRAAHAAGPRDLPILGINMGTLGFLTEVPVEEAATLLFDALAGRVTTSFRRKLHVKLLRGEEVVVEDDVLNDVVINKGALARMIRLTTSTGEGLVTSYRGDGLIVATPTGATAYSAAAGGPLLYPTMEAFVLTPICPHAFGIRPVVLPDHLAVEVRLTAGGEEVYLALDGQNRARMSLNDRLLIERSAHGVRLIEAPKHDFFDILRYKLGWG